jgi:hypothetical protein
MSEQRGNVLLTGEADGTCTRTRFGAMTHTFVAAPDEGMRVQCACGGAQLWRDDRGCVVYESMEDVVTP